MNIPSYTPNINATGPYVNPGNKYPKTNQVTPQNNYGPQPVYNVMPIQPYDNNMIQSSNTPLLINQRVNYSLEAIECMEDLNGAIEATITKEIKGIFDQDLIYTVSIKGLANRVIFITKKKSEVSRKNNSLNIKVKYVPRDVEYSIFSKNKDFEKRLFDISFHRDFSGFSIRITNKENDTLFGLMKLGNRWCCNDPDYQIFNKDNLVKYRVTIDGCQCSYCCNFCCCENNEIQFQIFDSTNTQIVWEILKDDIGGEEKITYDITFPIDATPEDKILIISAAITIDLIEFEREGMY